MTHTFRHIILFMPLLLLASCVSEVDWPRDKVTSGEGSFSLSLSTGELNAEVETRSDGEKTYRTLTATEAAGYKVTLSHEGETLWGPKALREVSDRDRTQPQGSGYVVSAENCTAAEAQTDWGQPRYKGESEFEVNDGETTQVEVKCNMLNAGFCVVFDKSFTDRFPTTYAVTTNDERNLRFDAGNAAQFQDNTLQGGAIAYYNMDDDGKHTVALIVTGSDEWDRVRLVKDIVLESGKLYRLLVRVGEENGKIGLSITYDSDFVVDELEILVE